MELDLCIAQARVAETPSTGHRPLRGGVPLPVKRHIFIDRKSLPKAKIYVATHQARQLPSLVPDYQTPHHHNTDEFYFFIGNNQDLTGLEGQIKFDGRVHRIISPATVYIPAGAVHEYKVTRGEGDVVVLFRDLDYKHIASEPDLERGKREAEKFARYIWKPDIRPTSELKFHKDTAPGDRHVFIDSNKMATPNFYTIVRNVFNIKPDQAQHVEPHRHRCDSYHLFIGNNSDYMGLKGEMVIEDKKTIIESPIAVHVPQGIPHYYRLTGGSGKFFNIVPMGNYNDSLL